MVENVVLNSSEGLKTSKFFACGGQSVQVICLVCRLCHVNICQHGMKSVNNYEKHALYTEICFLKHAIIMYSLYISTIIFKKVPFCKKAPLLVPDLELDVEFP